MSFKRWLALLFFYVSYLFFGASIYYVIEHNEESAERAIALQDRIKINAYIKKYLKGDDDIQNEVLGNITEYCGKKVTTVEPDEIQDPYKWDFYHSFFFAFTVCSTVGYGNLSPSTTLGRMVLIAYSLIGMPVNTILFAGLGEYFARLFELIYERYKTYKLSNNDLYIPRQFGLIATIAMALVPGIVFFLIIPSCIFCYFEGWPFTLSLYYSYVTTTTIGFGDYVPTFQPHQERYFGGLFVAYQIFIIVWFIFSLGYILMIIGYVTKFFRSKKLRELERQLKSNIKNTQSRIWHGVVKDVGYLRKIINEVYLSVKPIYHEPGLRTPCDLCRSSSCPDLSMYSASTPILSRKRAFSESCNKFSSDNQMQIGNGTPVYKASSDTDLNKINKEKTFETVNAFRETTNLLAKVVTALGNIQPPQYDIGPDTSSLNSTLFGAYHGFTDSQILSDEYLVASAQNDFHPLHRERASSDFFINPKTIPLKHQNEWTWCGDNHQIQQEINDRAKFYKNNNLAKTALYKSALNNSVTLNIESKDEIPQPKKKKSFVLDLFRRRSSILDFNKNPPKKSIDISGSGNILPTLGDKYPIPQSYYTPTTTNSSLKSERKTSLANNRSIETISQDYSNSPDLNQLKQRKGSLYPFYSNNIMLNDSRDSLNSRKSFSHRNSIFHKTNRSGSLAFPMETNRFRTSSLNSDSHRSRESICSDRKSELILENTSVADLIRALEVIHTRAVTQNDHIISTIPEMNEEKTKKKRKVGTSEPPQLSPLFTIFSNNTDEDTNQKTDTITQKPDKTRPTIQKFNTRRTSLYAEASGQFNKKNQQSTDINKYGRRFSVRPTELQIPPGKSQYSGQAISSFPTALQRRLSVRHSKDFKSSPLASTTGSSSVGGSGPGGSGGNSGGNSGNNSNVNSNRSSIRKQFIPISSSSSSRTSQNPSSTTTTLRNFNSNTNSEA
ncbi:open rectifier potassium channel protein 1 [Condylostylus longicornis]|uniref:open rectifier potassium channel protein 1 n=1 Tax=Condylostylus longicornis TaxID=2530218 RepID=UPI00244DDFA1|nr:open rectifier potassium channel protein 1 [Condylostylus longicornis]XP_055380307.1 open rectifier potassium channel protein 1 [Condylostylus longicornis]